MTTIERGGWFSSLMYRADLAEYATKLRVGALTLDEAKDYVAKGGSLGEFRSYDRLSNFFVGSPKHSILSFLIEPRYQHQPQPGKERLATLEFLLQAGADPNYAPDTVSLMDNGLLVPVLQAAAADDVAALTLFAQYDANWELQVESYLGKVGPALALAMKAPTLDWLRAQGANLNFLDADRRTLLHLAVNRVPSLEKIEWLLANGLHPAAKDVHGKTPLDITAYLIEDSKDKLQRYAKEVQVEKTHPTIGESDIQHEQQILNKLLELQRILTRAAAASAD